jgi:cytochrome c oxidase cbb3-type subunit 3
MSDYSDKLLEHDYDGIRELDNDLPRWWVWLFAITVIWGVLYLVYYHVLAIGYLSADEYQREIDPSYIRAGTSEYHVLGVLPEYHSPLYAPARDRELSALSAQQAKGGFTFLTRETDTTTYVALTDPDAIAAGKAIFLQNCFSCHGTHGEGGIGPNLTDDYWLHGAGMTNITKTIRYGYPTKGMLSWLGQLKPEQILQVASYVLTLHGTNPPNPKAPQGDLVKEQ